MILNLKQQALKYLEEAAVLLNEDLIARLKANHDESQTGSVKLYHLVCFAVHVNNTY